MYCVPRLCNLQLLLNKEIGFIEHSAPACSLTCACPSSPYVQDGVGVSFQVSPLSAAALASCLAATDALSQAVALQCRVLEETLQQLGSKTAAAQAPAATAAVPTSTGQPGGQETLPLHSSVTIPAKSVPAKRPAVAASADPEQQQRPLAGESGCAVVVEGQQLGQDLAGCWLSLYKAAADVDLAVAQLGVHM